MTDTATQDTLAQRLKQVPGLRQLMLLVGIAGAVAIGVGLVTIPPMVTIMGPAGWAVGAISLDATEWHRLKHFIVYVLAFSGGTWANMRVLMYANVETVIVFRSCAPLCMSVMDYVFYGRALPSRRSACAMLLIVAGAAVYVSVTSSRILKGFCAYGLGGVSNTALRAKFGSG